ncbi:hypothetical protein GCM10007852_34080 [Agaribacter marinus]|uniref:Uncharacterized protein n=1 Tax=Agaribacter marinus TaxID=1431249 RepID=A0AA37WM10_9ALTE|nr:hypothetical protein GCM10007852_34080 [Agaribacter marinus]
MDIPVKKNNAIAVQISTISIPSKYTQSGIAIPATNVVIAKTAMFKGIIGGFFTIYSLSYFSVQLYANLTL